MKVQFIDNTTPRSDGKSCKPTGVTLNKEYNVVEILPEQYAIMNDRNKVTRHSKARFTVTDDSPISLI